MGYFFDWVESKWQPIDHGRKLSRQQRQQIDRRLDLIDALVEEIEHDGTGAIGLFAGQLARSLCKSDELLMRARGEQVVKLAPEERTTRAA